MSDSSAGPFTAFRALLHRDLTIAFRRRGELLHPVFFFLMVITLFPFAIGPDRELLALIAPGVLWVAALLATLLALDRLFRSDHRDGSLEQLLLSPHPLSLLVLAKVLVHWLTTGLPLIVVTPLLAMMLDLPSTAWSTALVSLALGTLTMSLVVTPALGAYRRQLWLAAEVRIADQDGGSTFTKRHKIATQVRREN